MKRFAVLAVLALAACSLQPKHERPAAPVSSTYPTGAAYKDVSGSTAAADIGWRDFIEDPRLERIVELALAQNRDLRIAALNIAQYEALYRIERADLFPQVGVGATSSAARAPGSLPRRNVTAHQYSVGLAASWEIDFFGRVRSLSDAALEEYLATAEAGRATYIALVAAVVDQYLAMIAGDELLAVTGRTLDSAQQSYKLAGLRFDAGSGNELSVRQAETVVEQARANHAAQLRKRAQAENGLVLLVGQPLPPDLPPGVAFNAQHFLADIPAGLPSDLLVRRPDIMEAEALLRSANGNIGAARAAFFPSINLTAFLGTQSTALGGLLGGGGGAWSFVASIAQPIFQGGRLRGNLDLAVLQKEVSIARYEKAIQAAFRDVADGLAARGTYDDEIASLERQVRAYEKSLELSTLRFRTGVDSYLNVLTAQTDLYGAQQALVSARLGRLSTIVDLYKNLGGGWIERTGDVPRQAHDLAPKVPAAPAGFSVLR